MADADTTAVLAELDAAMAAYSASIDRGLALAAEMRGLATELSATATSRAALPGDDIAAAIALLERHGYTVTRP
jgi:hypothetical protein